jgi:hypothetical protein
VAIGYGILIGVLLFVAYRLGVLDRRGNNAFIPPEFLFETGDTKPKSEPDKPKPIPLSDEEIPYGGDMGRGFKSG